MESNPHPTFTNLPLIYVHRSNNSYVTSPQKNQGYTSVPTLLINCSYAFRLARVLIGFSFNPMLSGERSSGDIQNGFRGLRGLQFIWLGLYKPYPMRKYSIGISIACGCSSVTTDPQACTCKYTKLGIKPQDDNVRKLMCGQNRYLHKSTISPIKLCSHVNSLSMELRVLTNKN